MQIFFNNYNTNQISFNRYQKSAKVLAKEKALDDQIINLFKSGFERKQIAAKLDICLFRVGKALNKFNLLQERRNARLEEATKMLFDGYTYKEIAQKLGICESTVYDMTKENNILKKAKEARNQKVIELRLKEDLRIKEIAARLNITEGTVKNILHNHGIKKFTRKKSGV